ncbi:MAG: aminotransferase class IV, partial [Planctomycetota bacterium]
YPDLRWKRCDIKSLNLLPNVLARADAARKGCAEAIFVNDTGLITEGAASAFFAILGRKLHTAPLSANILPSITRKFVIRAAAGTDLQVVEEAVTPQQAASADELFIAVTTHDIVPVTKFDDKTIAAGKPGIYTQQLIDQFRSFT